MIGNLTTSQAQNFMTSAYQGIYQRTPGDLNALSTYINNLVSGKYSTTDVINILLGTKTSPTGTIITEYTGSQSDKQHWANIGQTSGFLKDLDSNYVYHEPSKTTATTTSTTVSSTNPTVNSSTTSTVQGQSSSGNVNQSQTSSVQSQGSLTLPNLDFSGISTTYLLIGAGVLAFLLLRK